MAELVDRPVLMLVVSFVGLLLAAMLGVVAHKAWERVKASDHNELAIVQSAALTLLGLIVGFSFAMAISRYDQRKGLEEAEANAIGTEYLRAGPDARRARPPARGSLKRYLDQRILFYVTPTRASSRKSTPRGEARGRSLGLARSLSALADADHGACGLGPERRVQFHRRHRRRMAGPDSDPGMVAFGGDRRRRQCHARLRRQALRPAAHRRPPDRLGVPLPDRRHRQPARRGGPGAAAEFDSVGEVAECALSSAPNDVSRLPASRPSRGLSRSRGARTPSLGQRLIRLFPRRTLFHHLRAPSGVGIHRPAAADSADRRRRRTPPFTRSAASGSCRRSLRRRPSRSPHRRLKCWAGGLYARWLAGLVVLASGTLPFLGVVLETDTLAAAGVARDRHLHHQGRKERRAALVASGGGDRRRRVSRQIHCRALPSLNRARSPAHAAAPSSSALAAVGRPSCRGRDRRPEPSLAGRERLAASSPTPPRWRRPETFRSRRSRFCRRKSSTLGPASAPVLARGPRGLRLLAALRALPLGRGELGPPDRRGRDRSCAALLSRVRLPALDRGAARSRSKPGFRASPSPRWSGSCWPQGR